MIYWAAAGYVAGALSALLCSGLVDAMRRQRSAARELLNLRDTDSVAEWLRMHEIDPKSVPLGGVSFDPFGSQWVVTVFSRNAQGNLYLGPGGDPASHEVRIPSASSPR